MVVLMDRWRMAIRTSSRDFPAESARVAAVWRRLCAVCLSSLMPMAFMASLAMREMVRVVSRPPSPRRGPAAANSGSSSEAGQRVVR